jgi:hypothetical protein
MNLRAVLRHAVLAGIACAATALHAHDSWLVDDGGTVSIVTGMRFPRADLTPPEGSIARRQCIGEGARSCWIELKEFDVTLADNIVDVYLREVRPDASIRARWQDLHARGQEWHERYRKFARIEIVSEGATPDQLDAIRRPALLDLEIVPVGSAPLRSGATAKFVVLAKGEPVKNQPVELVSDRIPLGVWGRTDEHGEVLWPLPFAANWLVRTILIEADGNEAWRSRFATFAFAAR